MKRLALVTALLALGGCSDSTVAECIPGSEGCECNMGKCLAGLVCLSNLCVDPGTGGTGGTTGTGGTVGTGGTAGGGGEAGQGGVGGSGGTGGVGGIGGAGGCVYSAQEQDAITCVNGKAPATDMGTVYFSAENCADAANTLYDLTLANADGVTQVYLWVGIENAGCEQEANRSDQLDVCRAVAGNPRTVERFPRLSVAETVFDLTLQDLVDTGIVDCAVLEGQHYEIYSFRNEDPGGNDVAVEGYGVAPFKVGVTVLK